MTDRRPTHPTPARFHRLCGGVVLLLPLLAAACATATIGTVERVGDLIKEGEFAEAVELAADWSERRPNDPRAEDLHRKTSAVYLLAQGREATFADQDDEALEILGRAAALAPEDDIIASWNEKIRRKLGRKWQGIARTSHSKDNLEAAITAYQRALDYDPSLDDARSGLGRALIQLNYRAGLSGEYYNDGLRALQEYQLNLARSRFTNVTKYKEGDTRTLRRISEVDRLLAVERKAVAIQLEQDGLYPAAYNEYRLALLLDPENPEVLQGLERMKIERNAIMKAEEADMMVRREEWDEAKEALEEGLKITRIQEDLFRDLIADIDEAKTQGAYEAARDLEYDFRYEQAIEAYGALLERNEYFLDARARKETLEEYVTRARQLYQQAEATPKGENRDQLLRQIEIFWPEYRDVRQQLEASDSSFALAPAAQT